MRGPSSGAVGTLQDAGSDAMPVGIVPSSLPAPQPCHPTKRFHGWLVPTQSRAVATARQYCAISQPLLSCARPVYAAGNWAVSPPIVVE